MPEERQKLCRVSYQGHSSITHDCDAGNSLDVTEIITERLNDNFFLPKESINRNPKSPIVFSRSVIFLRDSWELLIY